MIDILHASDGDIDLGDDFQMARSDRATEQHKRDILMASPGDFKESPTTGAGVVEYLNDENPRLLLREIRKQMQQDGIKVKEVGFDNGGGLIIEGSYDENN